MSWFVSKTNAKRSDFFKGINIFSQLNDSVFGKIKKTITELFGAEYSKEYVLPKVIVIGNESAGKSCLLENITKCQIFPRGTGICTKCPVHLKLNNSAITEYSIEYRGNKVKINDKQKIYNIIKKYLDEIGDCNISNDEIIINISEPNLPVFEFFDLPGIVSYPPENAKSTLELSKKYLQEKNTIVLCVVPATITRLTSCQSIALIKEMGMEENSILALTMADRVQPINIPELLINRLLNTTDELNNLNFSGCVAVVNRTHDDKFSLEENDTNEINWFQQNIMSGIPESHRRESQIIFDNITINNLVKQLDKLYSKYIEKEWKPTVIQRITDKKNKIKSEYELLGKEITNIDLNSLIFMIKKNIKMMCKNNYDNKLIDYFKIESANPVDDNNIVTLGKTLFQKYKKYDSCMEDIVKIDYKIISTFITENIIPVIDNIFNDEQPLLLSRFTYLKEKIKDEIVKSLLEIMEHNIGIIKRSLTIKLNDIIGESKEITVINSSMQNYFSNLIKTLVFDKYFYLLDINIEHRDFKENKKHYQLRLKKKAELDKVEEHLSKVNQLKV